jgi:predicted dehydrogenase
MAGIAIIGRGMMGSRHADAVAALGRAAEIRYVVARTAGGHLEAAPSATVIDDFSVVLDDPDIDVVSICTPTGTHRELAVRALRAGKNVLLEKPIALTMRDGRAIYDEAIRSGMVFMVAHVVRFFEGYRLLHSDAAEGKLGQLVAARATRLGSKPDGAAWLQDFVEAGGMLVDFGIHDFDQMNSLLGQPLTVKATGSEVHGPVETTVTYEGGGVGQVLSFTDQKNGVPFRSSLEVVGTDGFAQYDYAAETPQQPGAGPPRLSRVSRYSLSTADYDSTVDLDVDEPYARQLEYFLDCVERGAKPGRCPTPSALSALEVALAAQESLRSGSSIEVESL